MRVSDEDLRKLHAAGIAQSAIAEHFGYRCVDFIRHRERRIGLPPRTANGRPKGPSRYDIVKVLQPERG